MAKKFRLVAIGCEKASPSDRRFFIRGLPGGADGRVRLGGAGMAREAARVRRV